MAGKKCDKCGEAYSGFGTTCGRCRKAKGSAGGCHACEKCGHFYSGFGALCPDCGKLGVGDNRCKGCGKTAYAMERVQVEGAYWHHACFKCEHCHNKLSPTNFAKHTDGKYYCKVHYEQLFKLRGRYSVTEGQMNKAVSEAVGRVKAEQAEKEKKEKEEVKVSKTVSELHPNDALRDKTKLDVSPLPPLADKAIDEEGDENAEAAPPAVAEAEPAVSVADVAVEVAEAAKEEEPAPAAEPEAAKEEEPALAADAEPEAAKEEEPAPAADAEPEAAKEEEPAPAAEAEPEAAKEEEPAPAADAEPEAAKEEEPAPAADAEPEAAKEEEPAPAADAEPEAAKEEEPAPTADAEPEAAKEEEPAPPADAEPEAAKDEEPTPAADAEAEAEAPPPPPPPLPEEEEAPEPECGGPQSLPPQEEDGEAAPSRGVTFAAEVEKQEVPADAGDPAEDERDEDAASRSASSVPRGFTEDAQAIMEALHGNGDSPVTLEELREALGAGEVETGDALQARASLKRVSVAVLRSFVDRGFTADAEALLQALDVSKDGQVSLEELEKALGAPDGETEGEAPAS